MADEYIEVDFSKAAAGAWSSDELGNLPVDTFKDRLFARAGVPGSDDRRKALNVLHANDTSLAPRLPEVFPPADFSGPLEHVQDWLDLIASVDTSARVGAAVELAHAPVPLVAEEKGPIAVPAMVLVDHNAPVLVTEGTVEITQSAPDVGAQITSTDAQPPYQAIRVSDASAGEPVIRTEPQALDGATATNAIFDSLANEVPTVSEASEGQS